ncbi:MAG: arginine repressor [Clostridia bacterium]|nr:arginine repressor [Clostridia bacterium]
MNRRQNAIIEIITKYEIEKQEELVDKLVELGFTATQATVSRDIKQLGLVKMHGTKKKFRYTQVKYTTDGISVKFGNLFKESVLSIQTAGNMIVIRTVTGGANSAAAFLDKQEFEQILGTIAGDDCIFAVASTQEAATEIARTLKSFF